MKTKQLFLSLTFFLSFLGFAQSELTVEKIMQDPNWMGTFPSNIQWNEQSDVIYFQYNPEKNISDSLYKISLNKKNHIEKVSLNEKRHLIPQKGDFNSKKRQKVYTKNGHLMLYDVRKDASKMLLNLGKSITSPQFISDERISFMMDSNLYVYNLKTAQINQLSFIQKGKKTSDKDNLSEREKWLKDENLKLLAEVNKAEERKEKQKEYRENFDAKQKKFYLGKARAYNFNVSNKADYLSFQTYKPTGSDYTGVPNYADASGYTKNLNARSKVGDQERETTLYLYNIANDSVMKIDPTNLPEIDRLPAYTKDYPDREWKNKPRTVTYSQVYFSPNDNYAVVDVRSQDNKDRWICEIDLTSGELKTISHQHDEAWIGGPGINGYYNGGTLGWVDSQTIYYQSEQTGYSHLYTYHVSSKKEKALTSGEFEVFNPQLSNDKKHWYFTSSEVHPGERHFYKMPVSGGNITKLTSMEGNNEVTLSPDEKYLTIRFSSKNQPWELYLKRNKKSAKAEQLTEGKSEEFQAYNWRKPELIQFEASDGEKPYARLYKPEADKDMHAAVIFVHGAGYLQNAHKWWSTYFREYMFHNLLTDLGYTVLDIDYRGSAGYGRDWRTAIYRHMGGKDLSDQIDAADFLVQEHGINPDKLGIYGGSYGGFITLMAMFNSPDTFQAGAALRSVTDWAHYNHGYTSNILNEPHLDPIAYRRSSPIYFAEGLKNRLLIAHGIVDTNVHFQDVVRLSQRLIELGKDDWEMAVYPVEGHGFTQPSSWTDEYKRILKLFQETIGKKD